MRFLWRSRLVRNFLISKKFGYACIFLSVLLIPGCQSKGPEPILWGEDSCAECKMTIGDARFGAEVRVASGKILKFDSLDCLFAFRQKHPSDIQTTWVVDSLHGGALIEADKASFSELSGLRSPMGIGMLASADAEALRRAAPGSEILHWQDLSPLYAASQAQSLSK